ncbi:caspase Dronc [Sabethes cyaneus]|uniref:caspase Dronc n=1 Tax=Sabethes cyaneus TaxID=53552 RepID=UPI00221E2998|nr:caspase Dronc [Sabethes cyaneus]
MNQNDRQKIMNQLDQLIQNTNYGTLLNSCLDERILSEVMIFIIEDRFPDEATKHKMLFEKITKRGPTAFQKLLDICQLNFPAAYNLLKSGNVLTINNDHENFHSISNAKRHRSSSDANLIDPNRSTELHRKFRNLSVGSRSVSEEEDSKSRLFNSADRNRKCKLEIFEENVLDKYEVKLTKSPQQPKLLHAYPMKSRNRGTVFILNIITYINNTHPVRNGAKTDKDNLVSLFRQLGFKVFYYEDLTRADYDDLIAQLKRSEFLSAECFAFYVLAHGNHTKGSDKIYLHDNSVLFVEQILEQFNNVNCRKLIGKPKLFFFSICRGDEADYGTLRSAEHTERDGMINPKIDPPVNMPTFADMFICFSTVRGFAAHRDQLNGSWFVESMCEVWGKHAHDTDVEQLTKLVGKDVSMYRTEKNNALQTLASEQRGFFELLYLNPGYIEE